MDADIIPLIDISSVRDIKKIDFIGNDFAIFNDLSDIPLNTYPNRINALVIALCRSGHSYVRVDLREYEVRANNLLVTLPEQIIQDVGGGDNFTGVFILISPQFVDRAFKSVKEIIPSLLYIKENPCITLTSEEMECLLEYHSFLWKKVKMEDNRYRKEIAKGILYVMFYDIYNIFRKRMPQEEIPVRSRKEELFQKFMQEVTGCFKMERSVSYYADKLCLTPKHLSGVVKEVSGKTAGKWIDDIVILEARTLLKSSEMSIQEIAEYLHFANQSFFGKYFKHHVGVSPKEYRRS